MSTYDAKDTQEDTQEDTKERTEKRERRGGRYLERKASTTISRFQWTSWQANREMVQRIGRLGRSLIDHCGSVSGSFSFGSDS